MAFLPHRLEGRTMRRSGGNVRISDLLVVGIEPYGDPEGDQAAAMFGNFAIGRSGYIGAAVIIILVSFLTMLTSRLTVIRQLATMDGPGVRSE